MSSYRYTSFPASFNGAGLSLTQMGGGSIALGQNLNTYFPDGAVDAAAVILNSAKPTFRIPTRDLTTVFGSVSPTVGYSCTSSSVFRLQQRLEGAVFAGSTSNVTATAPIGFLAPESLSASGDQPAELGLMFYALSSTGAATSLPVTFANSVDFSAITPAHVSTFYLGPAYANSVVMNGLIASSIDFGINFDTLMHDGTVYPTEGSVSRRSPRIRLTFLKADMIFTLTPNVFNTATPGTFALYYRKGSPGNARVADATTSHCKISFATGAQMATAVQAAGETDATISWDVIPTGAVSVSVSSAIP